MSDKSFFFEIVQLRCGIFNGCDELLLWQVYVKFSALFRVSRMPFPYEDLAPLLSQLVSSYGANRIMWGRWLIFSLSSMKKDAKRGEMKNWSEKKSNLWIFSFVYIVTVTSLLLSLNLDIKARKNRSLSLPMRYFRPQSWSGSWEERLWNSLRDNGFLLRQFTINSSACLWKLGTLSNTTCAEDFAVLNGWFIIYLLIVHGEVNRTIDCGAKKYIDIMIQEVNSQISLRILQILALKIIVNLNPIVWVRLQFCSFLSSKKKMVICIFSWPTFDDEHKAENTRWIMLAFRNPTLDIIA